MDDDSKPDLSALGLPAQATEVLGLLGGEGWTTSVALAAQLQVSRSVICRAVDVLVEAGLVERSRGRRPAPLRLHPDVELVVAARLRELADRHQQEAARAERAAEWVRGELRRGRPAQQPVRDVPRRHDPLPERSAADPGQRDAQQVAALRRLFALWWEEGDPWRDPGS